MGENKELKKIFKKFDEDEKKYLTERQFRHLIYKFSKYTKIKNIDRKTISVIFNYYTKDGKLTFEQLKKWWNGKQFELFSNKNIKLLRKARKLFDKYTKKYENSMTYHEFEKLLDDRDISHDESVFDRLDTDGDGLMNFKEFVKWLGWLK